MERAWQQLNTGTTDESETEKTTPEAAEADPEDADNEAAEGETTAPPAEDDDDEAVGDQPAKPGGLEPLEKLPEELRPPEAFTAKEKEQFNRMPKGLRRAVNGMIGNLRRNATQVFQALNTERAQWKELNDVVQHHMPMWGKMQVTPVEAIDALCRAQTKMVHDPVGGLWDQAQAAGLDFETLAKIQRGEIQYKPQAIPLRQAPARNNSQGGGFTDIGQIVQNELRRNAIQQEVDEALRSLISERDSSGAYTYPELHDQAFQNSLDDLVLEARRTTPGLSYREAIQKAWSFRVGKPIPAQADSSATNLPRLNGARNVNKDAALAGGSLRGRSFSGGPVGLSIADIPDEDIPDSPLETWQMVERFRKTGRWK